MGKDLKRRFTVSLDIDTKDAEKQVKATAENIKTILADMGKASDKMGYFKELVDYIGQVDAALLALKAKHGDTFNSMFSGLDTSLKSEMEKIFGTSTEVMNALDLLRTKIKDAGNNKAGIKDLRNLAAEINNLFSSLGMREPINIEQDFKGSGKLENRIEILQNALSNFALTWDGVNAKIQQGFGLQDIDSGKFFSGISEQAQKEIDALEQQANRYQNILNIFNETFKMKAAYDEGDKINIDVSATEQAAKELIDRFEELNNVIENSDDQSKEYAQAIAERAKIALQLIEINERLTKKDKEGNIIKESPKFLRNYLNKGEDEDDLIRYALEDFEYEAQELSERLSAEVKSIYSQIDNIRNGVSKDITNTTGKNVSKNIENIGTAAEKSKEKIDALGESIQTTMSQSDRDASMVAMNKSDAITGDSNTASQKIDFTSLENTIRNEISVLSSKLSDVLKVEVVNDNSAAEIKSSVDSIKSTLDKISSVIDTYQSGKVANQYKAEVDTVKNNLTQLYEYISDVNKKKVNGEYQRQEISAAILSDGSISTAFGEKETTPWDRLASSLVSNLTKTLIADLHSHPLELMSGKTTYVADAFSGANGDLGAFRFSKQLGAQLAGMITGNVIRTLDLSKLTEFQMSDLKMTLAGIEQTYAKENNKSKYIVYEDGGTKYRPQSDLASQHNVTKEFESIMYEAFKSIGISKDRVDNEIFKKYDVTDDAQLTALSEKIVELSHASQNALSPAERLSEIISKFGGDMNSTKAIETMEAFKKGELSAADAFNTLNGRGYTINQDTLDSLYKIDSTNAMSTSETLLTQVVSVLNSINSTISNIASNVQSNPSDKLEANYKDIVAITKGALPDNLIKSIKSIYDPLNISEYKNQEIIKQAEQATNSFKYGAAYNLYDDYGNIDLEGISNTIKELATAISYIEDAKKQLDLYETRTKKTPEYGDEFAAEYIENKYDELLSSDSIKNLLRAIQEARGDLKQAEQTYKNPSEYQSSDGSLVGTLQSIQSSLDAIYGSMQGLDGSNLMQNRNFEGSTNVDYSKRYNATEDVDFSILNSILQAINNIGNYLQTNNSQYDKKSQTNENDQSELINIIRNTFSQQYALEDTVQAIRMVVDNVYNVVSQSNDNNKTIQDDEDPQQSLVYQMLASKLPSTVSSEDTLTAIKGVLDQIAEITKSRNDEDAATVKNLSKTLDSLVNTLSKNIDSLKQVADGIVTEQKRQGVDVSESSNKVATQYKDIISAAFGKVSNLGTDPQLKGVTTLADGVQRVEGAVKDAQGAWTGFIVDVNKSNEAIIRRTNTQSAFAQSLSKTEQATKSASNAQKQATNQIDGKALAERKLTLASMSNSLKSAFKQSGIDVNSTQLSQEQQSIRDKYLQTITAISELQKTASTATKDQIRDAKKLYASLSPLLDAYNQQQKAIKDLNAENQKAQRTYQRDMSKIDDQYKTIGGTLSNNTDAKNVFASKFDDYKASYEELKILYAQMQNTDPTADQKAQFEQAAKACSEYGAELQKLIKVYQKETSKPGVIGSTFLGDDFVNNQDNRKLALQDYFEKLSQDSDVEFGNFIGAYDGMVYTIKQGDGTVLKAKASFDSLGKTIISTASGTKEAKGLFGSLFDDIVKKGREITTYLISMVGIQEVWQAIRQGVTYVVEIDTALTELKKVTDETDASYNNFLQNMSKTASVVGTTVKDLTNMAAEWARLNI